MFLKLVIGFIVFAEYSVFDGYGVFDWFAGLEFLFLEFAFRLDVLFNCFASFAGFHSFHGFDGCLFCV